ncbi:hypothetical protein DFH09DRAFT_1378119 [Mycena vulgaris]|nr:hypothetical protein DFH09DRAFT_1378119 [Mycena vulgaris]
MTSLTAAQVTVKVTESSPQRNYAPRSPSPYKYSPAPSPTFRPKAKVNSSATPGSIARKPTSVLSTSAVSRTGSVKSSASGSSRVTTSLTPRSGSPSKQPSPFPRARAAITRGVTPRVTPQEPLRKRSLTESYASRPTTSSSGTPISEILDLSDADDSPASSPRITAKKSGRLNHDFPPSPPLPPNSSLRALSHRARVPSISSNASSSAASGSFYPAAAATPAANRFPSVRASPPTSAHHYYQPFPRDDPAAAKYAARPNGMAKVDPATIPLPPHSPPTSAVSFSSRSSLSPSSTSYVTESGTSQLSAPRAGSAADSNMRSGLENLMNFSGMLPEDAAGGDYSDDDLEERPNNLRASTAERKVRAEAKSVRKIADLEITNRSLLAINTSLEQTKHRQAKEIRELRRKLRESRLILPPRAGGGGGAEKVREEHDVMYRRIKVILEGLLESGQRALETTPQDFPEPVKVAKVLSAYEVPYLSDDDEPRGAPSSAQVPASPSHVAVPDSSDDDSFRSEDEVEAMTLPRDSPPPSHPPSPQPPPIEISEPA